VQLEEVLAIGDNREQWEQLCFAIGGEKRDKSTVVLVVVDSLSMRHALQQEVARHCNLYQHHILDFSNTELVSLTATLQEWLPQTVLKSQPVQHMVHVFGLENSLTASEEGELRPGPMLAEVNFQRELLFAMPFITVLWADRYFEHQLQTQASDLWSWLTYRYRFSMPEATEEETQPLPELTSHFAMTPEMEEKLKRFQEAYESIRLDGPDTGRRLKAQLNVLLPWAQELSNARQFDLAEQKLQEALRLAGLLRDDLQCGHAHFLLGTLYYHHRKFNLSMREFEIVLDMVKSNGWKRNLGNTYHMMGRVHEGQQQWGKALEMFWDAIKANKDAGMLHELGSTYHHIGMVLQNQLQWDRALEMYREAIKTEKDTGQLHELGGTYHQMGMVYQEQRQWGKALDMYGEAINANKDSGQLYQLGITYHQMGRTYEEQQLWDEALKMYSEAIEAKKRTGQLHELGSTYHQIGYVYEEQGNLSKAFLTYQQALDAHLQYAVNAEEQAVIERAISRVKEKLGQ